MSAAASASVCGRNECTRSVVGLMTLCAKCYWFLSFRGPQNPIEDSDLNDTIRPCWAVSNALWLL